MKDATRDLYEIAASNPERFEKLRVRLSERLEPRLGKPTPSGLKERISKAWDALIGRA